MIQVVDGLDLSGVPIPFLEAYPFPAFVLAIPVSNHIARPRLISRDTDITVRQYEEVVSPLSGAPIRSVSSITIAWSNERWLSITEGRPLDEMVDPFIQDKLQTWIEEDIDTNEAVFTLDLTNPAVTLHLSRTIQPMTPPSTTHAYCIITSQVRRRSQSQGASLHSGRSSPALRSSVSTELRSSFNSNSNNSNKSLTEAAERRASAAASASGSIDEQRQSLSVDPGSSGDVNSPSDSYFPTQTKKQARVRARGSREKAPSVRNMISAADEFWALLETFDWSRTKLGPKEKWIDTLAPLLSVAFQSKTQDCLWLGEDLLQVYNKQYGQLVNHPSSFGRPGKENWPLVWDYIEPMAATVMGGTPIYKDDDLLLYKKYAGDYLLESYFTWRYVPITIRDGTVIGFFNQASDTTDRVLAERRLATIREMSEAMLVGRTSQEYYDSIRDVFEQNPKDAPFVLCYKVDATDSQPAVTTVDVTLERTVGVPEDHPSAPKALQLQIAHKSRLNLGPNTDRLSSPTLSAISALSSGSGRQYQTASGSAWPIQKALTTRQCVIVEDCQELIQGYPIRAWDQLPFAAVVVPICSDTTNDIPEAVLIIGLNVRRPLDSDYDGWIHVLRSQLASALVSVKAYEAEQQRIEDAMRMENAKSAWFRGAAHDLRSPLTLVKGPLEDLLSSDVTPVQKSQLVTAKRNVDRLLRLVNALLDFSRLEAGRIEGKFVPVNLGLWVSDLADLFRPAVERLKIEFIVDIQFSETLVYIDPILFETVVSNLIGNALKYTEKGSITVKVTFDGQAEISVIDTGVGIPRDEVPHVTEWFHRASTAIHSGTQGTGLGLALAKELLKLHEGELLVTSQTKAESGGPHGSTFIARIPMTSRDITPEEAQFEFGKYGKAVADEAMRWKPQSQGQSQDTGSSASDPGEGSDSMLGSGSRVGDGLLFEKTDVLLLADDNVDMREYIRGIFSRFCKVIEASNGEEALELAIQHRPHLVITDVMMPKMSGMELLTELRKRPETRITPVVLLTAMASDEARVEALLKGAEDYIEKPFKPKELLARAHLHMQVGKKRAKLEVAFAERETEIAVLSDYCPSGIMRADEHGSVTYANDAWRVMAGMNIEDDANDWGQHVTPDVLAYLLPLWTEFLEGDEKELRISWRWSTGIVASGLFIRLAKVSSTMTGIIGCVNDITYEEQRVVEAEQRRKEAEESKHQQELLIDLTSHEIRTPVSAILQCSSLVKENLMALKDQLKWSGSAGFKPTAELLHDLEEDVEALESIYQCGLVQERIAGDVLSLARIQLDMLSLYDVEMDLKREARKVLSVFASEAKMKKIDLNLEFGQSMEMAKLSGIKTDPVRLGQVVTNLISNAIRFTASSDVRAITTTYDVSFVPPAEDTCALPSSIGLPETIPAPEDTPIWLFVSVRDTGPGLGPKELAILFKRFSQGNKMIHTRYGGSGLGLFICRKITELLGGRIEVQSQLGHGSVFRFFIKTRTIAPPSALASFVEDTSTPPPLLSPTGSGILSRSSSSMTSAVSAASVVSTGDDSNWSDYHILIVEDNIINQTVLKRQLVKAGLTCDVANNGLEALNLIREADRQSKRGGVGRKKTYNAVLMDLEMPVMDGLTAVKEIRAAETSGTLNRQMVIALTGNARQGQIDHAIEAGMDDVVIKPYVLKNLLQKIRSIAVKRREMERDLDT